MMIDKSKRKEVGAPALVHVYAVCQVCGEVWNNYLTAQKLAAAHAIESGHTVKADLGYVVEYSLNYVDD